jgi:hypothetical protein
MLILKFLLKSAKIFHRNGVEDLIPQVVSHHVSYRSESNLIVIERNSYV